MTSIFIFRRDLRIKDNTALNLCFENSEHMYLFFLFNDYQTNSKKNSYFSPRSFYFMLHSLLELQKEVTINYCYEKDFMKIVNKIKPDSVYFNLDYTPYAKRRDNNMSEELSKKSIQCITPEDYTLYSLDTVTGSGQPYQVFTPYYNNVIKKKYRLPYTSFTKTNLRKKLMKYSDDLINTKLTNDFYNTELFIKPGRKAGLKILRNTKLINDYEILREDITKETTLLSPHIKFGTVSIREVGEAVKINKELFRQIVWHDFYANLVCNFDPSRTLEAETNFRLKNVKYGNDMKLFKLWCEGKTGFPLVDAAMRQLNKDGWIHNRLRLIVSNFLVVILNIDWHFGEMYFASQLIDYDPCSNNGNWQWNAQVGVDRASYYPRVFNPMTSQKNYDPDFTYCKRYLTDDEIYNSKPIINFEEEKERARIYYDKLKHSK